VSRVRYIRLGLINVDTHMLTRIVSFNGMRVQAFMPVVSMDMLMQQTGPELSNVKASIPSSYAHQNHCDGGNDSRGRYSTMCRSCRRRSQRITFTHHPSAKKSLFAEYRTQLTARNEISWPHSAFTNTASIQKHHLGSR
jgi:hypothetical protein